MLRTLNIRDFVIVDALEIDFRSGFTVFSGETGAGKSILIDALALTLGERADAGVVREGATRAEIAAEFEPNNPALSWLDEQALVGGDSVLMRRVIDLQGRSRSWINGTSATLSQMRELGEMLVDIHGQHAHQRLMRPQEQRALLDEQAGLGPRCLRVAERYRNWRRLYNEAENFERDRKHLREEEERLQWQVGELEKLALGPLEWEEIQQEHQRLAHAAALISGSREIAAGLDEGDDATVDRLTAMIQKLTHLAAIDETLGAPLLALDSARIQAQEAAHDLRSYLDRVELDPERLAKVEARMDTIHTTARRFKLPPGELPAFLAEARARLSVLAESVDAESLRRAERIAQGAFEEEAKALSGEREAAALALGNAVTQGMQTLSMTGGRLRVALIPSEPSPLGLESVEFQVATHPEAPLRPLTKVASGGELARISLALAVITSTSRTIPTLIFDEVDSGIGGAVAEVVGRLLRQLGQQCQVLCVTHLAQVAAQAEHHFSVNKLVIEGRTTSQIQALDAASRIDELARMLGGIEITSTTRKHARELLAAGST